MARREHGGWYALLGLGAATFGVIASALAEPAVAPSLGPLARSAQVDLRASTAAELAAQPDASDAAIERAYKSMELRLTRKADGSFHYAGRGIGARLDSHGGLTMWNKFSGARFVMEPTQIDEHRWVVNFFRVFMDLYARLDKAFGNDPYRSERRDFLEQTRELRTLLLERNAERALERMLEGIWKLAHMSIGEKKERLFALWTECSGDHYGQKARRRIAEFIREHCGPGSACEYGAEELERLNTRTKPEARFAPYADGAELSLDAGLHED